MYKLCSLSASLRKRVSIVYINVVTRGSPKYHGLVMETLETVLTMILVSLLLLLHSIPLIIMVNILIRPSLWTAFNIVGLIYLWFTVILGGYKMVQLSAIVKTYLSLEDIEEKG